MLKFCIHDILRNISVFANVQFGDNAVMIISYTSHDEVYIGLSK